MRTLKNNFAQVSTFIALFILSSLFAFNLSAHTTDSNVTSVEQCFNIGGDSDMINTLSPYSPTTPNFIAPEPSALKIKIVIIIVIKKKKKKGVYEVESMRLAGERGIRVPNLKENEILAEASVEGDSFIIYPIKGKALKAGSFYGFPPSFKVSKEVSAKLGIKTPMSLKASKLKALKANSLGNFEIQD